MKIHPKTVLIIFGVVVVLFIFFSSVAVHELVHALMDGFANHQQICFFGWNELVGAPLNLAGWYDSSTVVSEVPAYIVQGIYLIGLTILAWVGFWRIYDKI
jgi:hypothetical protein